MAKVKVINVNLDQNLNGINFNDTPSKTIFTFGSYTITSNFDGKKYIDYSNTLSSFVRPVTLETMGVSDVQSEILYDNSINVVLNLNKSDLNTFVRFGSTYEFLRISTQNIILKYPGSLFVDSQKIRGRNITYSGYTYDSINNISTFYIPVAYTTNTFELILNSGNTTTPNDDEIKNLNISYDKYVIWNYFQPDTTYTIIGYTGNTVNSSNTTRRNFLKIQAYGEVFSVMGTGSTGNFDYHIKPNSVVFEEFRSLLTDYEKYIVSQRDSTKGFNFLLKDPTLLDDGTIIYSDSLMLWTTGDKYNIDINTSTYQKFLQIILTIGSKYDQIKTDLIARFLTPDSLKAYDLTEQGKITKLLRIYGREFDQIRQFIDSLAYINKVTYNKINNIPDQLIKNLARTFGWDYFSLVNENELVESFLTIDDIERNLNTDLMPAEIDIELWRRILNNTNYFWKSKGTREAIKSIFLLIGIPEPFINITEYVYTVEGKIDPRNVILSQQDFPSNSLPYDSDGYPIAPTETNDFYFQVSGDTDSGQEYLNVFRMAGFNLKQIVDNKKSWIQTGSTIRVDDTTPQYYQEDSKLVINTKEIDVALDTARGIEYDVYDYIKNIDYPANNSGYTFPFSYVNISLNYTGSQNIFTIPTPYNKTEGDLEVRFNGILLNAPKTGTTSNILTNSDYIISGNSIVLTNSNYAKNYGNERDVVQLTFIYSGGTIPISGITVQYIVTRIKPNITGTEIPLPSLPRGDVQLTINGIALTKGTNQFNADYIVDTNNTTGSSKIIIQNPEVISYLAVNPNVQVAYVQVNGTNDINARNEILRVDSFNSNKIYYITSIDKYVYKLNYKANSASDIKFLINGIALEPIRDYNINTNNPYEVFLPTGIRYGSVISVYYLVGTNSIFTPIVNDEFGVGDISNLSFLEFIELIQRKMINARNRKTVSDFKGGWYPTLLKIYETYLDRSKLSINNPLHSNGYTFQNLYSFLSKYNTFFQRFVNQLLPTTIILRKSGLLIRNTVFSKQKFTYKRGVNVSPSNIIPPYPYYGDSGYGTPIGLNNLINNRENFQYLGDDGSMFMIEQAKEPEPIILYVETVSAYAGVHTLNSMGGYNIVGKEIITEYGIQYREGTTGNWINYPNPLLTTTLTDDYYSSIQLAGLLENTNYQYRAYIIAGLLSATGNTLTIKTEQSPTPNIISGLTKQATSITSSAINNTGGKKIMGWECVDSYGMQYREYTPPTTDFDVVPTSYINIPKTLTTCNVTVFGETTNAFTAISNVAWLIPQTPDLPSPVGVQQSISIAVNTDGTRTGCITYTPTVGSAKVVTLSQVSGLPSVIPINVFPCSSGGHGTNDVDLSILCRGGLTSPPSGQYYYAQLNWSLSKAFTTTLQNVFVCVECNSVCIDGCQVAMKAARSCNGSFASRRVNYGDNLVLITCVESEGIDKIASTAMICINNITNGVGNFSKGTSAYLCSRTISNY